MLNNNQSIYNIILLACCILAAIVGYFIFSIIRQQKMIFKWQKARIAAEIDTLENERKRIVTDLHDELGPLLSAIKLQINHLEPVDEMETAVLEKSSQQIDDVVQRFRDISYNLLPNTLIRKGFIAATNEFIGKMKDAHPLEIVFECDEFKLSPQHEINLYRIEQEIVHNTIKHANATALHIHIIKKDKKIIFKSKDNGIGFNYVEKEQVSNGLGLMNLQSRAEVLGGQLMVETQPGKGTAFEIEIPLQ